MEEKLVGDYSGLNFLQIDELDVFTFWILRRDAVIYNCMKTDEGRDYLDNCWRLEQTEPDREKIRARMATR